MATETPTTSILTTRIDPTSARFEANMRYMADLVSAVRKAGQVSEVQILSERGGTVRLKNPWSHRPTITAKGRRVMVKIENGILIWETRPGTIYRLK